MNNSKIEKFADKTNNSADRMDKSIKGIGSNSSHDCSHEGNHILEVIFQELQKIENHQKVELNWFKSQNSPLKTT